MWGQETLFWICSIALIACALLVVFSPSTVSSAMFLILGFFFLAGLYMLLHAFFLGVVQILVYAGAVMVLFLFVIMLLDPKIIRRWWFKNAAIIGGPLLVAALLVQVAHILRTAPWHITVDAQPLTGTLIEIVRPLFTTYLLPLEVTGLILMVAAIGVVVLGRRDAP